MEVRLLRYCIFFSRFVCEIPSSSFAIQTQATYQPLMLRYLAAIIRESPGGDTQVYGMALTGYLSSMEEGRGF